MYKKGDIVYDLTSYVDVKDGQWIYGKVEVVKVTKTSVHVRPLTNAHTLKWLKLTEVKPLVNRD